MYREMVKMLYYVNLLLYRCFFSVIRYVTIHTVGKTFNAYNLSILNFTHSVCSLVDKYNYSNKSLVYDI